MDGTSYVRDILIRLRATFEDSAGADEFSSSKYFAKISTKPRASMVLVRHMVDCIQELRG